MPYHLEKGPIFSTIEAMYNDPARLPTFLQKLWRGQDPLGTLGVLTSPSADDPNNPNSANATGAKRLASMISQWFGEISGPPQPPWGTVHPDPVTGLPTLATGYWSHYYGDVRAIVGESLMRAGEVALGVDRPAQPPPVSAPPPEGTRRWAVEFFWKCGQPRFEGWVTWRRHQEGPGGQVTVIFATPATPDLVLLRPGDEATEITSTTLGAWNRWQGMWVCSHANHAQFPILTVLPTGQGQWLVPTTAMFTLGFDDVGTWSPNFGSGGSRSDPIEYEPGP
jgi:hypothetical protein